MAPIATSKVGSNQRPSSVHSGRPTIKLSSQSKTSSRPTNKHPKCKYENCTKFARKAGEHQFCMKHQPADQKKWCIVCRRHIAQYAGGRCTTCAGRRSPTARSQTSTASPLKKELPASTTEDISRETASSTQFAEKDILDALQLFLQEPIGFCTPSSFSFINSKDSLAGAPPSESYHAVDLDICVDSDYNHQGQANTSYSPSLLMYAM